MAGAVAKIKAGMGERRYDLVTLVAAPRLNEEEAMVIHIVRFRSALPEERIAELCQRRAPEYLTVAGLMQKYHLRFRSGEHGGVYVWDSVSSMERFMAGRACRLDVPRLPGRGVGARHRRRLLGRQVVIKVDRETLRPSPWTPRTRAVAEALFPPYSGRFGHGQ
jgi:hypothetical protein